MLLKKGSLVIPSVIILIMSFPSAGFGQSAANGARAGRALALQELSDSIEGVAEEPPRVSRTKEGYLRFIMAPPSRHFSVAPTARGTPQKSAAAFLERWWNLFVNESEAIDFDTIRVKTSASRTYVRLQQRYAGLEVLGAQMIVQVNTPGGVVAAMSDVMRETEALDTFEISLDPTISALTAQDVAVGWLAEQYEGLKFEASPATPMIFSPSVVGKTGPSQFVWQTEVSSIDGFPIEEFVCVDAHSGEIAFHYSLIYDAKDRDVYDSNNTTADPGTLEREEGDPCSGIIEVDRAYDYLGDAYDFYDVNHGRDGITDEGNTVKCTVRYCFSSEDCPMASAYWRTDIKAMYLGDAYVVDDIVGHEYTHGVTQHESNLYYGGESGAINESLSDMWGEWIDQVNGDGNDTEAVKWLFGEDRPGGAKRDMADPPQYSTSYGGPMPDSYNSPYWYDGAIDNSGVHHNSSVGNKLCYLLTDGDTFNGYTISEMNIPKTADLFYECQVNLLTPSSDYYDLGDRLELAASNLGFTQSERNNVGAA